MGHFVKLILLFNMLVFSHLASAKYSATGENYRLRLPEAADYVDRETLFNRFRKAGFSHIVEFAATDFWGRQSSKPFIALTGDKSQAGEIELHEVQVRRLSTLSYKRNEDGSQIWQAFQVGEVLVCYKRGELESLKKQANQVNDQFIIRDLFYHCFAFPSSVDSVVEKLASYQGGR